MHLRLHYLDRILDIVQAQPEHAMLATRISRLIRHGYKSRNPLSPEHLRQGYSLATEADLEGLRTPVGFAKCRSAAYVTGLSGIGKSTSVERVLSAYPQVITHERYRGCILHSDSSRWLKIECPHDGSAKQLCLSVLEALDTALEGTDYFEQHSRRRSGVEHLIAALYEASQGITDVAVNIFMILQENAIVSGIETFGCQDVAKLVTTLSGDSATRA